MTSTVQAIVVGYAVPRTGFDAVVHSVFKSAVNLKPAGEGRLLTLLVSDEADLPQGIRLEAFNGFSFEELPVGIRGVCRDGILNLEDFPLTIDLRKAKRWGSNLSALHADMSDPKVMTAWQSVWQAVNHRQLCCGSGIVAKDLTDRAVEKQPLWIRQTGRSMRNIFRATAQCDLEATRALESLIGLGPGLTPSGDDLVTGYLIGLWCTTKGKKERLNFLSALGEAVIRLSKCTNDISSTCLFHATRGQASSKLVDLAIAICAGADTDRVLESARGAMHIGHTSGMDAVTGLLFGLAAWDGAYLLG